MGNSIEIASNFIFPIDNDEECVICCVMYSLFKVDS